MSEPIRIGILGSSGRMGRWITQLLEKEFSEQAVLTAAPARGEPLDPLLTSNVIIDFSSPLGTAALVQFLELQSTANLPALVVGSTGLTSEQTESLRRLAKKTAVLASANFSTGVHAILSQLETLAPLLSKLGYQARVKESHHVHKKDAPSGTALLIQRHLAPLMGTEVPISSIREGEVIGDHEICFEGVADRIYFRHEAMDRSIFARGAIESALWAAQKAKSMAHRGELLDMRSFLKERLT